MNADPSTPPPVAEPASRVLQQPELNLLLHWDQRQTTSGWLAVLAASLAIHLLVGVAVLRTPVFVVRREALARRVAVHRIPLYLPLDLLTQRAPNRKEVTKSIDLADLLSTPSQQAQRASPQRSSKSFEIAKQQAVLTAPKPMNAPPPPQILAQAPTNGQTIAAKNTPPPVSPSTVAPTLPTAAPATQKPQNMPFQNLETDAPENPNPSLRPPKVNLRSDAAVLAPSHDGRQTVMSDDNPTEPTPGRPGLVGNSGERHAAVELKSDPQGADFKPYLTRILAIVRSNWQRVIPESVRSGAVSGRTTVEFIITRDGQIPKMVTATSSGSDPLDRAAVAGLSMSNPLPPLPADYKGYQVRLAFSFDYNMPTAR